MFEEIRESKNEKYGMRFIVLQSDIYVRTDRKINMNNISELTRVFGTIPSPSSPTEYPLSFLIRLKFTTDTYSPECRVRSYKLDRISKDSLPLSLSDMYILNYLIDT